SAKIELPSDFDILSPPTLSRPECIQMFAKASPAARDWASSFSWWGKRKIGRASCRERAEAGAETELRKREAMSEGSTKKKDVKLSIYISHIFFQAEDGIRDRNVTGVQTLCSSDLVGEDRVAQ